MFTPTPTWLQSTVIRLAANSAAVALVLGAPVLSASTIPASAPPEPPTGPVLSQRTEVGGQPVWSSSYSERYPGCVALPLFPAGEAPVALVTRTSTGRTQRISVDAATATRASDVALRATDGAAIGACR